MNQGNKPLLKRVIRIQKPIIIKKPTDSNEEI
jgi:hypothetical protein